MTGIAVVRNECTPESEDDSDSYRESEGESDKSLQPAPSFLKGPRISWIKLSSAFRTAPLR